MHPVLFPILEYLQEAVQIAGLPLNYRISNSGPGVGFATQADRRNVTISLSGWSPVEPGTPGIHSGYSFDIEVEDMVSFISPDAYAEYLQTPGSSPSITHRIILALHNSTGILDFLNASNIYAFPPDSPYRPNFRTGPVWTGTRGPYIVGGETNASNAAFNMHNVGIVCSSSFSNLIASCYAVYPYRPNSPIQ